jgi:hypothetical protein
MFYKILAVLCGEVLMTVLEHKNKIRIPVCTHYWGE